jgi:hypothetical protein
MSVDQGNWFTNQKEVSTKIQNISADGRALGEATTYVADGAISLDDTLVLLDASSASTQMTLANGTAGQVMFINAIDTTNTCNIDYTNILGTGNTVTFTPAGEYAIMAFNGTGWFPVVTTGAIS